MILLLLTIAIIACTALIVENRKIKLHFGTQIIILVIFLLLFSASIVSPIAGYAEPVLEKEIHLESFSNKTSDNKEGEVCLVFFENEEGIEEKFIYREASQGGEKISTKTAHALPGDIEIYESELCDKPIIKVYEKKARGKWWFAFAIGSTRTIYKIYLPEDSVIY